MICNKCKTEVTTSRLVYVNVFIAEAKVGVDVENQVYCDRCWFQEPITVNEEYLYIPED